MNECWCKWKQSRKNGFSLYREEPREKKIYKERIDKAIEYIEQEKTRLAKEVSNIYIDTLDRTKLVNEDIYNELDKVLDILKGSDSNE